MYVVIDGYNLLHAARASLREPWHLSRSRLCRILGDWSEATSAKVIIIFDGREPHAALAEQLSDARIEVRYSGRPDDCGCESG
jgi:predicted RNA-binding protein with PIN domain